MSFNVRALESRSMVVCLCVLSVNQAFGIGPLLFLLTSYHYLSRLQAHEFCSSLRCTPESLIVTNAFRRGLLRGVGFTPLTKRGSRARQLFICRSATLK